MTRRVTFEKIVSEGKAMAHWQDKALFAIGPLPGEVAEVTITREKKTWAEATVDELVTTAKQRGPAKEAHYLSCSPWQGVDYAYQIELKNSMLKEIYARPELGLTVTGVTPSPQQFGYRNKLEFTLHPGSKDQLSLAFHERGSYRDLVAADDGCVLGSDGMNQAAEAVLAKLNQAKVSVIAETLTVRQSATTGAIVVVVLITEPAKFDWSKLAVPGVAGVAVVTRGLGHNQFKSIWQHGDMSLPETIGGIELTYPWEAFSQVNIPAFGAALEAILGQLKAGEAVADLYGGAGTIGLPASRIASRVIGVESSPTAVKLANYNARANNLTNYEAIAASAEHMDAALLKDIDTVIVDPPRAGLHPKMIDILFETKPERIIYLSCNPVTQARDLLQLAELYDFSDVSGFDFYPGTLHLESLVTLTRKH